MDKANQLKIVSAIGQQIAGLLDEEREELFAAYERALADWDGEKPKDFKFAVGFRAILSAHGNLQSFIAYGARRKAETPEVAIIREPDMVDKMEAKP